FISCYEYAVHSPDYKILAELSISASGPVGSVLLLSRYAPQELSGKTVLLSSQSATSASLVRIILEEFFQVTPCYETGSLDARLNDPARPAACLAIGDEALRFARSGVFPIVLDLAELWQQHTGLPFVFAVWAVREGFCQTAPATVTAIHQELLRCLHQGQAELMTISQLVAPRIPMDEDACYRYLCGLEYDLDAKKQRALALFFEYLIRRDEVPPTALPLKIC
ncbi:MAG: ABC transporter substrate-binding protein, partial [Deltaproteobacteria bacterium CG23_combo_of_CG06-09_8_20_14_all_60_8]